MLVARRAGIDVAGVGMPGHFVISLGGATYLDPFNRARALSREDCLSFLERTGFGRDESLIAETPDRFVLARMLANLLNVYKKRSEPDLVERYRRLFDLFRGSAGM
jgi:regulator of sirC expression with transglutaminase-like and TPR domain